MKGSILFLFITLISTAIANTQVMHFPDPLKEYGKSDRGWAPMYLNPDLINTQKVALTFDDGPDPILTPKLLDILKEHNASATFFILSSKITPQTKPLIERMVREGHFVASHGEKHINVNKENESEFKREISQSIIKIKGTLRELGLEQNETYFRFPYGDYGKHPEYHHLNALKEISKTLFQENCINFAFWDIDTADWVSSMKGSEIAGTIMAHIQGGTAYDFKKTDKGYIKVPYYITKPLGGGVVLMHDIHKQSIEGTRLFLERIRGTNIQVIPLNEVEAFDYGNKDCRLRSTLR